MNQRDRSKPFTLVDNTYVYDANGNRTSKQTLAALTTYHYDATERLVKVDYPTGSEEYRYDKAGNIQKNHYDGEGLRAEMEENGRLVNLLLDGEKVVAETDGAPNVIRYIRGYDLISSDSENAKTYYHYASDEMGSITHVIDEAGNVCNHYDYDAFSNFAVKAETIQNRFEFTGEQCDTVAGLYYLLISWENKKCHSRICRCVYGISLWLFLSLLRFFILP